TTTNEVGGAELEVFTVMGSDNRTSGDDAPSFASLSLGWGCDGGVLYRDADGDGVGSAENGTTRRCGLGFGWSVENTDCDDRDPAVRPGAAEQCNGLDDDCDGQRDEGLESVMAWRDGDGDGFGQADAGAGRCGLGRVTNALDCDDSRASTSPDAGEVCNGRDDDCDGEVDGERCVPACVPQLETCNGEDDDCDGLVDEVAAGCPGAEVPQGCACGEGAPLLFAGVFLLAALRPGRLVRRTRARGTRSFSSRELRNRFSGR
ncbi:MAG: putative metal-binding motif-containing protein, partial [Myxococcaceae bacterium]|nr:putative metal-binding motif-containing protein [Myxococcaceae bacterium]